MDLIERQKAINAIENTECELLSEEWNEITDAIMSVPPAQPEIIRCKECAFSVPFSAGGFVCRNMSHAMEENDYCSRAERREE